MPSNPTTQQDPVEEKGPYRVRATTTFGGNHLHFNRYDDLAAAEREAGDIAAGRLPVTDHAGRDEEFDRVWVEDLSGTIVWSIGGHRA
jgi:hypothetical protein